VSREIKIPPDAAPPPVELALLPLDEITRGLPKQTAEPPLAAGPVVGAPAATRNAPANGGGNPPARARGAGPGPQGGGFQRAAANPNAATPAAASAFRDDNDDARDSGGGNAGGSNMGAADGLLINGSVNNGSASPFAQARAFGNNRPGGRGLYNGGIGLLTSNSAFDSRPFSFNGQSAAKPQYNDVHFTANFGGPIRIPHLMRRGPNFFGNYQHVRNHDATTQSALMPTALERAGDFSQSRNAFGQPVRLIDPATGQPFPATSSRPIASARRRRRCSAIYPQPNADGDGYNYQTPLVVGPRSDTGVTRLQHQFRNGREQLQGVFSYNRNTVESANPVSLVDTTQTTNTQSRRQPLASAQPVHVPALAVSVQPRTNDVTPRFPTSTNVSGLAGIQGNDQSPATGGRRRSRSRASPA
jgi:hypothetical protein